MEYKPDYWQLRTTQIRFQNGPAIMGIVNVTPDSFSDGGKFRDHSSAIDHALRLADEGADILDIGGESTRPYATPVEADEELDRVIRVVEGVCRQTNIPVSIDTSKAIVAREAIAAGAEIITDVTGFEGDSEMVQVAIESAAGICAMHAQGTPQTMQDDPQYENVVEDIFEWLRIRQQRLLDAGIPRENICLDPGIGFGKTHEHNFAILKNCRRFLELGMPILVGHSRKGFIGKIIGDKEADKQADRAFATLGVSIAMAEAGMHVLRVHDVAATRQGIDGYLAAR